MNKPGKISKETAEYNEGTSARHCGNCSMWVSGGACTLVRGRIEADDVCKYWKPAKQGSEK